MATLEDLEARIAALEASQADYRAVIEATNALGTNQREHSLGLAAVKSELAEVKTDVSDNKLELGDLRMETRARLRSVDEQLAEISRI